ncbi:MAG: hypothetical protein IPK19_22885 [Chloroflexi bacterium]|nr:hypothetical protein [Chloroflexota bacterium]
MGWHHQGWGGHGWGHRRGFGPWMFGGFMFAPLLMLAGFLFLVFFIFKTGLWIPLLLLGALFYFFSPMRRGWNRGGWEDWGRRWESRANEWRQRWESEGGKNWQGWSGKGWGWGCEGNAEAASDEKAKRTADSEATIVEGEKPKRVDYV